MYKTIEPNFIFQDKRGRLVQLVREGYRQVNIITTKGGVLRGGHFHKENREAFYVVSGSCEVTFTKDQQQEKHMFSAGDFFEIPPCVGHVFRYPMDCVMVGLYDKGVEKENGEKDIYPIEA